jgi:hypothetical protein
MSAIPNHHSVSGKNQLATNVPRGGLLDATFQHLPAEHQKALIQKALEKRLDIEVEAVRADQHHAEFERESVESVRHLRELNRVGMDINAEYRGRTASGEWSVNAKKSNYSVTMVIAIVIGILGFVVLSR